MCGIAGLIHRGKSSDVGSEMTSMLQSLKHRGPDSTGFALYGAGNDNSYVMRLNVAEQEDMRKSYEIHQQVKDRLVKVDSRLAEIGVNVTNREATTEYSHRYHFNFDGDDELGDQKPKKRQMRNRGKRLPAVARTAAASLKLKQKDDVDSSSDDEDLSESFSSSSHASSNSIGDTIYS